MALSPGIYDGSSGIYDGSSGIYDGDGLAREI